MAAFIVTCDLNRPGGDYVDLIAALKSYPNSWHYQEACWIVGPAESAYAVADHLNRFLDKTDGLFVQRLTEDSACWGFGEAAAKWVAQVT
jgi:hypothetical protein